MVGMALGVPYTSTPPRCHYQDHCCPHVTVPRRCGVLQPRRNTHHEIPREPTPASGMYAKSSNFFILINGYFPFKSNVSHIAD